MDVFYTAPKSFRQNIISWTNKVWRKLSSFENQNLAKTFVDILYTVPKVFAKNIISLTTKVWRKLSWTTNTLQQNFSPKTSSPRQPKFGENFRGTLIHCTKTFRQNIISLTAKLAKTSRDLLYIELDLPLLPHPAMPWRPAYDTSSKTTVVRCLCVGSEARRVATDRNANWRNWTQTLATAASPESQSGEPSEPSEVP